MKNDKFNKLIEGVESFIILADDRDEAIEVASYFLSKLEERDDLTFDQRQEFYRVEKLYDDFIEKERIESAGN